MAMTVDDVTLAVAKEAKVKELQLKLAKLQSGLDARNQLILSMNAQGTVDSQSISALQTELNTLLQDGTPVITDNFGARSVVDNAASAERVAGQTAAISAIKANPSITSADTITAWTTAALAARPSDRQWLLCDPSSLLQEYTANLVALKAIPDNTWASFTTFIVNTPTDTLLSM